MRQFAKLFGPVTAQILVLLHEDPTILRPAVTVYFQMPDGDFVGLAMASRSFPSDPAARIYFDSINKAKALRIVADTIASFSNPIKRNP